MPTVQGVYKFKRVLTLPTKEISQDVNFTTAGVCWETANISGGTSFVRFKVNTTGMLYYRDGGLNRLYGVWVYKDGWFTANSSKVPDPYANAGTIDFGTEPQEVSNEWFNWLVENTELDVFASYRGSYIAGITADQSATIGCAGEFMYDDITVKFDVDGYIVYNGMETLVKAGQTATIKCGGRLMQSDILINVTEIPITGLSIHGVIREYIVNAGASVSAGDFVEFVTKYGSGEFAVRTVSGIQAYKLDNERVIIGYLDTNDSNRGAAVVVKFSYGVTTIGEPCVFSSTSTAATLVRLSVMDSNTAIACYQQTESIYEEVYALVLKITDSVKITKCPALLLDKQDTCRGFTVEVLDGSNAVAVYTTVSDYTGYMYTYAKLLTAAEDGTLNKTAEADMLDGRTKTNGLGTDTILLRLSENKLLCMYSRYASNGTAAGDLYAYIITTSITGITWGSASVFDAIGIFWLTQIDSERVLQTYSQSGVRYARVLTIGGSKLTAGEAITLCTPAAGINSAVGLSNTRALAFYGDSNNSNYLTAAVLQLDGSTITILGTTVIEDNTASSLSPAAISSNSVVLAYTNGNGASKYAILTIDDTTITVESPPGGTYVQPATSNRHSVGVANSSGSAGDKIGVHCVV